MISIKQVERYPIESSPFYRIGRAKDLADLLGLTPKQMTALIVRRSVLYAFKDEVIGGKQWSLAVPINEMRSTHERIKNLFSRIVLPRCEFSIGCPFGPDRGDWSYHASDSPGGSE